MPIQVYLKCELQFASNQQQWFRYLYFLLNSLKHVEAKRISKLPPSVAKSPIEIARKSDVTPPAEENLEFDDDTLKGEEKWSEMTESWLNHLS